MPLFTYKATDAATAAQRRGTIAAETPRQARDVLRGRGLVVRDLADDRTDGRRRRWGAGRARVPRPRPRSAAAAAAAGRGPT